ncbi:mitochondrial FAD carrier protein flx1 [Taxawa tesnikishii (nom. ined.)]|nr:mitochondrial FAD carrier protein flx1 [Dothideales sp. JES 119]
MPRVYPPIEGKHNPGLSPSLVESIAGFSAGIISTLVVHPFDVVKTRLQVAQDSRSHIGDSVRIIRQIARNEGSYLAFYRGLMPNMLGNSVSWALYFLWYGNIKDLIRSYRDTGTGVGSLTSSDYFLASGASGILTAIFTNPIWVIKTRMLSTGRNTPAHTRQLWKGQSTSGTLRV